MKRLFILSISLLFIAMSFVGCVQSVTETGNPCPLGDCTEQPSLLPNDPGDVGDPPDMANPDPADDEEDDLDWYVLEADRLYIAISDGWTLINQNRGGAWQSVTFKDSRAQSSAVLVQWHELDFSDMTAEEFANEYSPGSPFLLVPAGEVGAGMLAEEAISDADGSTSRNYLTTLGNYAVNVKVDYYPAAEDDVEFFLTHIVDSH